MKEKNPRVKKPVAAERMQKDEWLESKTHFTTIKGENGHEHKIKEENTKEAKANKLTMKG